MSRTQLRVVIELALAVAATMGASAARAQPATSPGTAGDQASVHVENARRLAGSDVTAPFEFFCTPGRARPNDFAAPPLTPVRLFDNLYAAGNSETVVYAITTSAGIILIDSGTAAEVEPVLVPGLQALGLDPADVKLVLLGHGHSDHFGGASYFQSRYGAKVATTAADWDTIAAPAPGRGAGPGAGGAATPAPSRDVVVREGEPIVLGDTTITPVEIPGHTPGALAFVFPVFDSGTRYVAGLFGGTVLATSYVQPAALRQYVDSVERYVGVAAALGVDVEIQNHPIFDDTPARLAALAARRPGEPHPFVMGTERYQRFWRVVAECMRADIVRRG